MKELDTVLLLMINAGVPKELASPAIKSLAEACYKRGQDTSDDFFNITLEAIRAGFSTLLIPPQPAWFLEACAVIEEILGPESTAAMTQHTSTLGREHLAELWKQAGTIFLEGMAKTVKAEIAKVS